jgi:hypothetical protein
MQKFPTTAQVMDLLLQGSLRTSADDFAVGRLLVAASIYHEGLWYKITVQTTDLVAVKAEFGDNGQVDNVRDPELPDRLA